MQVRSAPVVQIDFETLNDAGSGLLHARYAGLHSRGRPAEMIESVNSGSEAQHKTGRFGAALSQFQAQVIIPVAR